MLVQGAPSGTPPSGPAASVGPYTGVAVGTLDRFRRIQNSQFRSNSTDFYRARFTYSFQIDSSGHVSGVGTGAYLAATWHLDGSTDSGAFSCDVPMVTKGFGVRVTGNATTETITLRFAMEGSGESNDDYDCGADFTGFATDAARLADSPTRSSSCSNRPGSRSPGRTRASRRSTGSNSSATTATAG